MVSTFTPNIQLEEPARGDDVGVWDTPVNNNMTVVDLVAGGIATIGLNSSPVVLSAAQFQSKGIVFNSTLTASVSITFPTSFKKSYEVTNACTGINFVITLGTTAAGGQVIAVPPGETIDVVNDGTNLKYKNLGRVGSYMDFAATAVPGWITACTVPPYLNCDGTSFSSATYPVLAVVLGGTTLPDARGRTRHALNQGTGRVTAGGNSIDGNTLLAGGGTQSLLQVNLPNVNFVNSGIAADATLSFNYGYNSLSALTPIQFAMGTYNTGGSFAAHNGNGGVGGLVGINTVITSQGVSNSGGASQVFCSPGFIGGITLIRAG